jgi:site-specific DNA-methyltransferase (adenine-specific)
VSEYTLYLGDCLELLPTLAAGSIDAVITDLPYGTTACSWDEVIPFAPMWKQVRRLLKPRGAFVTTARQPFTSALVMSNPDWFRYELIWQKTSHTNFFHVRMQPAALHENILVFYGQQPTYNPQMQTGKPYTDKRESHDRHEGYRQCTTKRIAIDNGGMRYPSTVQLFSNGNNGSVHPTQKPVALMAYLIRTYTNAGDTVLDFTMGSGTTGVAAAKEGRNFVGIELDEGYFAIAQKRIAEAAMQLPLLEIA